MQLSIDPGLRTCGWAVWDKGRLHAAGLAWGTKKLTGPSSWYQMARGVWMIIPKHEAIRELWLEYPQIYPVSRSKGDNNDLIQIAGVAGAIVGSFHDCLMSGVKPREWKGQLPKDICVERIRKRLDVDELNRVKLPTARSLWHNVFDSIGIGLHFLKRF